MINIAVIALAIAVACLTINTIMNNLAIAKINSLLHPEKKMQEAVKGMVYEILRSESITLDSKAVQKATHDRVQESLESYRKNMHSCGR